MGDLVAGLVLQSCTQARAGVGLKGLSRQAVPLTPPDSLEAQLVT